MLSYTVLIRGYYYYYLVFNIIIIMTLLCVSLSSGVGDLKQRKYFVLDTLKG